MSALTELLSRYFGSLRAARLAVLEHLPASCSNRSRMAQRLDATLAGSPYPIILAVIGDLVGKVELQHALDLDDQRRQDERDAWTWKFFKVELRAQVEHGLGFRPPAVVSFDRVIRICLPEQMTEALRCGDWDTVLRLVGQTVDADQTEIPATRTKLFGSTTGYVFRPGVSSFLSFSTAGEVVGGSSDLAIHSLGLRLAELGQVEMVEI
jgi:hypothetical protein